MTIMIRAMLVGHILIVIVPFVSSFSIPGSRFTPTSSMMATDKSTEEGTNIRRVTWEPQDLTQNRPGFPPLPENDYIKQYQRNPRLWPVEFFLIAHRQVEGETQVLVRASANGTAKWGLGTGVPTTRWLLSSQKKLSLGYEWTVPKLTFEARDYPEFPHNQQDSWTYQKIDIRSNAFSSNEVPTECHDAELEDYASQVRDALQQKIKAMLEDDNLSAWESSTLSVVQSTLDNDNSAVGIQGTLRMSGLFARRDPDGPRYVSLDDVDPQTLAESVRVYTMFPQMPDPMPLPTTSAAAIREEIECREQTIAQTGRDAHRDRYGRTYTHKSTPNVSNTIHGIYLSMDVTNILNIEDEIPAFDVFGTKATTRQWVSLKDLNVLNEDGTISEEDTKPVFISGFIVRQLFKEGVFGRPLGRISFTK